MLTPKQEKFCQCIVRGMDGVTAYENAYDTKASPQVKRNESMKLMKRDDITERIKELRKPLLNHIQNTAISEREEVKQLLKEFMRDESLPPETRMKASDQLNKMNAEYININRNIEDKSAEIDHLDAETLKRLAGA